MEVEGSLPQSQVPTTCPYPEPARSNPHPTSHFLNIHLNIIIPSTPGSPKWSLSFRFPRQNSIYASPLPHTRYLPQPSHSSRFYHPNNIGWGVQPQRNFGVIRNKHDMLSRYVAVHVLYTYASQHVAASVAVPLAQGRSRRTSVITCLFLCLPCFI